MGGDDCDVNVKDWLQLYLIYDWILWLGISCIHHLCLESPSSLWSVSLVYFGTKFGKISCAGSGIFTSDSAGSSVEIPGSVLGWVDGRPFAVWLHGGMLVMGYGVDRGRGSTLYTIKSLFGHIPSKGNLFSLFNYRHRMSFGFASSIITFWKACELSLQTALVLETKLTWSLSLEISVLSSIVIWAFRKEGRWVLVFLLWASQLQSFAKRWQHFPSFSVTWAGRSSCSAGGPLRLSVSIGLLWMEFNTGAWRWWGSLRSQAEMVRPVQPQALPGCRGCCAQMGALWLVSACRVSCAVTSCAGAHWISCSLLESQKWKWISCRGARSSQEECSPSGATGSQVPLRCRSARAEGCVGSTVCVQLSPECSAWSITEVEIWD